MTATLTVPPPEPAHHSATPEQLARRIVEAGSGLHTSRHALVTALAAYDHTGEWVWGGTPTCAHWAARLLDVRVGTAREWLRVGHALERLPAMGAAFAERRLSYCKVRMLTRIATAHPTADAELAQLGERVTPGELSVALAVWTGRHEDPDERAKRHREETYLSIRTEPDGMSVLTLRAPALAVAEVAAVIDARMLQGIDAPSPSATAAAPTTESENDATMDASAPPSAVSEPTRPERPTLGQQRADALVGLLTGHNESSGPTINIGTEVIIHLRSDGITLHDGTPLTEAAFAEALPASFIRAMIHNAESRPINVSERHRFPTDRQKLVLDERYPGCVDCGSRHFLRYHHEPPFEITGRTLIDELDRRCERCHQIRHGDDPRRS